MQIAVDVAADVGVVEFFPRGGEATSVGAAHAHGVEIHHPHLMQISVFQECFRLDKHHDFAQKFFRQCVVAHPFQVGRHLVAIKILPLVEEGDVDVAKQAGATCRAFVVCQRGAKRESVNIVDFAG